MQAGMLKERAAFLVRGAVVSAGGGETVTWTESYSCWAGFKQERMKERVEAGRLDAPASGVLTVRYCSEASQITTSDRATLGGVEFNILSVTPDTFKKFIEMYLEAV
ncbi:phage head closure protein [Flexibacterium corallicola]|uniref:phage head closure protein n=1 Tax=Flexibacterium corallicola TaxID=3037259 RepID=UPI00286F248A|nr:phage head closure protein [Pseudovibrio sp. M1P-2-3]